MIYREFIPALPLKSFVDCFWYCEGLAPAHRAERVMPSGSASIVFALANDWLTTLAGPRLDLVGRGAPAVVVLPRTESEIVATADFARLAGVHFRPWGLGAFFREVHDFGKDREVPLDALWGAFARELRERLLHAPTADSVFAIFEDALSLRLRSLPVAPRLAHAVLSLENSPGPARVRRIAEQVECSERHLHRVFTAHVGLSPKQFHRVRRFRNALDRAARCREVNWAELAIDCGYADQSHFLREFRAFSGVNPTAYFTRRGEWTGHLPVDPLGSGI